MILTFNVPCTIVMYLSFFYFRTKAYSAVHKVNWSTCQCSTFRKKYWGQLAPKFSFFVARTSILIAKNYNYLRINGFSFAKDNGLSLVYVFAKKKVTYLGGQVGDQAWKFSRHWVKAGRIGDPTGLNVEPCLLYCPALCFYISQVMSQVRVSGYG